MRKTIPVSCLLSALAVVALGLSVASARQAAAASPAAGVAASNDTLKLPGLGARVTVRRDERGVPYIEAASDADLYFAQGYATASDRLWQMDVLRRAARGELAEIFGRVVLEEDKKHRRYGFAELAGKQIANLAPELRSALEAYARGVSAFIASRDEQTLPVEFRILKYRPRAWTAADCAMVGALLAEDLSTSYRTDLMRAMLSDLPPEKRAAILPEFSPLDVIVVGSDRVKSKPATQSARVGKTVRVGQDWLPLLSADAASEEASLARVGLHAEGRAASNNWVVSGKRTASGKPLLANDPHLAPTAPSIWYLIHLSAPGLRVAGVSLPGAPGVIIGHNERIAWGMTNLGPDVQDLYRETFDPANPRRYKTPAGWREAEVRREEIKVRKSATSAETETVPLDVTVTRHGPVILEKGDERYALRWTMLDPRAFSFPTVHRINRARDWDEFRAALKSYPGPTQNFIYADVDGHIGYYGAGNIPVRKSGDGSVPYDGATDAGEWTGFIPFDKLPHVYDPPSGEIVTANQRVVGRDYPYFLTREWSAPYRALRIKNLLAPVETPKLKPLTADDFRRIQADTWSLPGFTFARELAKLARSSPASGDEKWNDLPSLLEAWDGRVAGDSRAALLVDAVREAFQQRLLAAALGTERAKEIRWFNLGTFLDRVITEQPREWLPKEFKSYAEFLRACHSDARGNLTKRLGADESQWTYANPASRRSWWKHPLADAPFVGGMFRVPFFATGGNGTTPNVASFVSMRLIADPSDWDKTQHGFALGQSGDPKSPHYKDQLEDWRNVTPRAFPFSKEAVEKAARTTLVLEP
jgi:penicillin G amidase